MLVGYLTLLSGLLISAIAIYYSVEGLVAIYPAMVVPIVIMGVVIELGKLSLTVWLKQYWERAPIFLKTYMLPAVAVLMLITSIGVFGFLSKAHSDQNLVSGDVQSKIAIYDEKIKTAKENIESNRKQLKQMDDAVDQVMARSSDEKGADKANAIRKSQSRDRVALTKDIEANQKLVIQLNDQAAPIRAEVRKVEADVGPIKYIAAFIYGVAPDANMLEKAVTWITILIVIVLDPLAVVLLLASQYSFAWAKEQKESTRIDDQADDLTEAFNQPDPVIKESFEGVKDPKTGEWIQTGPTFEYEESQIEEPDIDLEEWYAYANELEQEKATADAILQQGVTNSKSEDNVPISDVSSPEEDEAFEEITRRQAEPKIEYKILDEDSEADWPDAPATTFTYEADKIIVHDDAGVMVIPLEPELPVATIINAPGYVIVDGQIFHEDAAPPHIKPEEKTYVQNEEQAESNQWLNVVSKTQTVSETEYLNTLKKQENNGK